MKILVSYWQWGEWINISAEVARVTKTMIVVRMGCGKLRFNRRTGWLTSHSSHGLAGMTDPSIPHDELERFEAELKALEAIK